ncbi:MAG: trypsin-like peptidase domain-containing protein [Paludibacteraceae bacterium]|nr:trypsin-like peptidase domain-containing protein [Paludibacteraceae bacterium]
MKPTIDTYYALRFRSTDDRHRRGDICYGTGEALYIGQTPECGLRLVPHTDYADTCYAVIVLSPQGEGWQLLRQDPEAAVSVNGQPLPLVRNLHDGDILQFDRTVVRFTLEQGALPTTQYVPNRPSWPMRIAMTLLALVVAGVVAYLLIDRSTPEAKFRQEIQSIYRIQADSLFVLATATGDTLGRYGVDRPLIGTGFLTEDGYFVTARHCLEFWLGMEDQLCPSLSDIGSDIVRQAILAEEDTTLHLVVPVRITSYKDEKSWVFTSDDFLIDRSHDGVYDLGDMQSAYLWRSVISRYEKRDCELGDIAVMRWPEGKGTIRLAEADQPLGKHQSIFCFGFPQNESSQQAEFTSLEGKILQLPPTPDCWFTADLDCDPGFSGGPVFSDVPGKRVVGLVSRSAGKRTALVPAARIRQLIHELNQQPQ